MAVIVTATIKTGTIRCLFPPFTVAGAMSIFRQLPKAVAVAVEGITITATAYAQL